MYCPKCGTENPDDAQLCQSCNWVLTSTSQTPSAEAKTSGLAITSLVLGILSIVTSFLTAIPAIIFGIIALVKIKKSAGTLKGKGLAIAGIAVPAIMLAFMIPALMKSIQASKHLVCKSNLRNLSNAMAVYTNDYDKYPTPEKWCDLLIEYADVNKKQFHCPGVSEGPGNYAMNKNLKGLDISKVPLYVVVLFETQPGWNQNGGPEILAAHNHHKGSGYQVVFGDFHVEFVKAERLDELRWTVDSAK